MGCKVQQRAVAAVPLQAQGEEELRRLLQIPHRPVRQRRAVEEAVSPLAALVRRVGHRVAEEEVAGLGTTGLPIFRTLRVG